MTEKKFTVAQLLKQRNAARATARDLRHALAKATYERDRLERAINDALERKPIPRLDPGPGLWCDDCGEPASQVVYQQNRDRDVCPKCIRPSDDIQL